MGINRQQLNKYLSGLSMPSLATLRNIAAHFDLEPDDLLLPTDRFAARWRPPMRIEGLPPRMRQAGEPHQPGSDPEPLPAQFKGNRNEPRPRPP